MVTGTLFLVVSVLTCLIIYYIIDVYQFLSTYVSVPATIFMVETLNPDVSG